MQILVQQVQDKTHNPTLLTSSQWCQPPVVYVACNFSISLPTLVTIYPFNYSHRSECDVVSYFNLICISLMTNIVEHLSLWLFNSGQLLSCVQLFATP